MQTHYLWRMLPIRRRSVRFHIVRNIHARKKFRRLYADFDTTENTGSQKLKSADGHFRNLETRNMRSCNFRLYEDPLVSSSFPSQFLTIPNSSFHFSGTINLWFLHQLVSNFPNSYFPTCSRLRLFENNENTELSSWVGNNQSNHNFAWHAFWLVVNYHYFGLRLRVSRLKGRRKWQPSGIILCCRCGCARDSRCARRYSWMLVDEDLSGFLSFSFLSAVVQWFSSTLTHS